MKSWLPTLPRPGRVLAAVLIAAALNCIHLEVIGGAEFLVGAMLVMPFVLVLPVPWAVVAALLVAAPTLHTQGRPFLVLLAGIEAWWLATIGRRARSAALADVLFWVFAGLPVGLALFSGVEGRPVADAAVRLANHALNSLLAVLVAEFVVRSTQFAAWVGAQPKERPALRGLIFNLVFTLSALPLVVMVFGLSFLLRRSVESRDRAHLEEAIEETGRQLELHLRLHRAAVITIARTLEHGGADAPAVLLDETRRAHPAFITMFVADAEGRVRETAPQDPRLHGASIADRGYFRAARDSGLPDVSGVFRGRGFGRDVLVAITVPMHAADGTFTGVVEGSVEVHRFGAAVTQARQPTDAGVVVVDATGRVVFADPRSGLRPLERVRFSPLGALLDAPAETRTATIEMPDAEGALASVHARSARSAFGMTVVALLPATAGLEQLLWVYLLLGAVVAAVLAVATWVAKVASWQLASPLERFANDAVEQAESGAVAEMRTPAAHVPREIAMVFAAFNCLAGRVLESHGALMRTNAELDARVAERTRELRAAQERAEAASRSKTEFVAMTGHEIRTPLNAIIGLADAVADEVPAGPVAERVRTIHRAGTHLLGVVNDLLDLSRVEAGKLELRPAPVELSAMAAEVMALFSSRARQQGLTLGVEINAPRPLWLYADAPRLQQVLINLVGNALKFTHEGGVRLRIAVHAESESAVTLRFTVIDSGVGISAEEQARLFQPYVQLSGAVAAGASGSGLGLAISRRLVELFGGTLEVQSVPGQGSEFGFSATFRRAMPPAVPRPATATPSLSDLHVLIVDDNAANQEVLRAFLEGSCSRIDVVSSAREGLARLEHERFDVALVDLEMPEEGGDVIARALTARGSCAASADCLLIAVSAHSPEDKRAECLALGFDGFIAKPIDRRELVQTLLRLMSEPGPGSQTEVPATH